MAKGSGGTELLLWLGRCGWGGGAGGHVGGIGGWRWLFGGWQWLFSHCSVVDDGDRLSWRRLQILTRGKGSISHSNPAQTARVRLATANHLCKVEALQQQHQQQHQRPRRRQRRRSK